MYYRESQQAYFFNRCRQSFEAILFYYQSGGILVKPPHIPLHVFAGEVTFYKLGRHVLRELVKDEHFVGPIDKNVGSNVEEKSHEKTWQEKIWELFESPDSSLAARVVSFISMFVIGVSIIIFCVETLPIFRIDHKKTNRSTVHDNDSMKDENVARYAQWCFAVIELCCVVWFTLEYFTRLLTSPSKLKFVFSPLNAIDLFAILPYFVSLWINIDSNATPLSVLRVVRLVRVFRIFKLSRHSASLQILGNTLRASIRELGMLIFFVCMGVLLFSSALYYADYTESGPNRRFRSIPHTFWYSLVTMTTIGYGDLVPGTCIGKLIGSACALAGVLTLALPVPVIVSNFEYFYKRDGNSKKKENDLYDKLFVPNEDEKMSSD